MKHYTEIVDVTVHPADELRIGGITRFTTIDFPGILSAVLFLKGCPWKCLYCQNPELQSREFAEGESGVSWDYVKKFLKNRHGLIDGVVFSGGEPCTDPALFEAVKEVKGEGYKVGLHTGGMYPRKLKTLLPYLDWVGLDIKAPLTDDEAYAKVVQRRGAASHVIEALEAILAAGISLETRTTAHPDYLSEEQIEELAKDLVARGVKTFALQIYRQPRDIPEEQCLERVGSDYPSPQLIARLESMFDKFTLRRS